MMLTALVLKWLSIWVVLLFFGLSFGPTPGQGAWIAFFVAILSILADKVIPFRIQGITRWAIDGGLAAFAIYVAQFVVRGQGYPFWAALFAGAVIGAIEIPIHYYLASRFGLGRRNDEKDGIR
ncbi:MAG TPA: DUF2512 family protein [Symbiobacteriaceae bacterium]|nr:DUF2512 family protein [Symbiobacteriaceae bacterium]